MGKKKRSTLPKDFREILDSGDTLEIRKVFESCDVNAVGGYGKETAIAFDKCPDDILRWLVANGADLSAKNTWGRSAVHNRAGSRRSNIAILLELGASVSALDSYGNTPLHSAADSHHAGSAKLLLEHGAQVSAVNKEGLTPIELGLRSCTNIDIENTVELVRTLLEAGAKKSDRCNKSVETIGQTFEFHREGFNKDSVEAVSSSLDQLYEIFDVSPIPRRLKYDGKSPIVSVSSSWQELHAELWNLLVPSSGHASTVQGELIRVSGRILNEIEGNGGANWDADFSKMAKHFVQMLKQGAQLSSEEIEEASSIVKSIRNLDGGSQRLAQLAVTWVGKNQTPLSLDKVAYKR
jgi:hypothetical protein